MAFAEGGELPHRPRGFLLGCAVAGEEKAKGIQRLIQRFIRRVRQAGIDGFEKHLLRFQV